MHVAAWIGSIGGVETQLALHRERDAAAGLSAAQIALFDRAVASADPGYRTLGFSGGDSPRRMRRLLGAALAENPDSVVLWHNGWGLPWFADVDRSRRRIVCWWDSRTHFEAGMSAVKRWVDGVICMSDAAATDVAALWPELPPERCTVLRVPVEAPNNLSLVRESRSEWVIGCAGRLVRAQKRVDRLIPFVAALKARGVPYRIEVLSDGPLRRKLQTALSDDPAVSFLGWQSSADYWRRLQTWDAMVAFTDHEGGPIVMLEAMAAGVLPVFPDIGGSLVRDYLRGLSSQCVYPPGEVSAAADRMQALMRLPGEEARRLRERGRQIARRHTVEGYHQAFVAFVEQINQLPRISKLPAGDRGFHWADHAPLGILTRLVPAALWR